MADEPVGFLGRWARRKADAREGKPLAEPPARPLQDARPPEVVAPLQVAGFDEPVPTVPALTLEDAQALTSDSNFSPFMARQVSPEVRNAAMKKLFSDPHFNVMDGLDIYIDDYNISEPIPPEMMATLNQARGLLFDEPAGPPPGPETSADCDNLAADGQNVPPDPAPSSPPAEKS